MRSLTILPAFILTFNTLLIVLAASWRWPGQPPLPPFTRPPPFSFPGFPPFTRPPPSRGFPPFWPPWSRDPITNFYSCVNLTSNSRIKFDQGFYDPNYDESSFTTVLNSTAENLRCLAKTVQKPRAIFTPSNDRQVQAAVQCAALNFLNIRVRSGGHDYEGLSYISYTGQPFVIVDLRNIRKVDINIQENTAWADAGITVGALYYLISQKSKVHGFPAGLCPDLGIGGHITGGAYGSMMRKYGLGVDHAIDAKIVNAWGQILDRKTMGEDLFWAIRGGGGGNFGIILRWKLRLVSVPEKVTVFSIPQLVNNKGMQILQKWQKLTHKIDNELFIRVIMVNAGPGTALNIYQALYLGGATALLSVMKKSFPELGLQRANCTEMSWIESVVFISGFAKATTPRDLLDGKPAFLNYFKAKSDFVMTPIPNNGLEGMFRIFGEDGAAALMIWTPYGGQMLNVPEDATAFPHRQALFKIQYVVNWNEDSPELQLGHEAWIRKLYDYMGDYVSQDPREAYVNYRDLDIGKLEPGTNCSDPTLWGPKYYKGNYQRLVDVKTRVDPFNLFHNEQSIPTANYFVPNRCVPFDVKQS